MVAKQNGAEKTETSTEVAPITNWDSIRSWDEAVSVFQQNDKPIEYLSLPLLKKEALVGIEFLVLDWREMHDDTTNRDYVNVRIMNRDGKQACFNDGSTGVYEQCKEFEQARGYRGGIHCLTGLRKSVYMKDLPDGSRTEATTYYFS